MRVPNGGTGTAVGEDLGCAFGLPQTNRHRGTHGRGILGPNPPVLGFEDFFGGGVVEQRAPAAAGARGCGDAAAPWRAAGKINTVKKKKRNIPNHPK